MALGDKKPVVMEEDRGVPGGIATLGADGKLVQMPSAADVGAVTLYDGEISDFDAVNHTSIVRTGANTANCPEAFSGNAFGTFLNMYPDGPEVMLQLGYFWNDPYRFLSYRAGNTKSAYGTPWRQLATTDYALSRDSKGVLKRWSTHEYDGGRLALEKPASSTMAGNYFIDAYRDWFRFFVSNSIGAHLDLTTCGSINDTEILHTGNKPSGSYTGNGSAVMDPINIGGIGNALLVSSYNTIAYVTKAGAIAKDSANNIMGFDGLAVKFENGVLTIASADGAINYNGQTYYYQVL